MSTCSKSKDNITIHDRKVINKSSDSTDASGKTASTEYQLDKWYD